jgi:hypothetical protein
VVALLLGRVLPQERDEEGLLGRGCARVGGVPFSNLFWGGAGGAVLGSSMRLRFEDGGSGVLERDKGGDGGRSAGRGRGRSFNSYK